MFRRVLVPMDLNAKSLAGVDLAYEFANQFGAEVNRLANELRKNTGDYEIIDCNEHVHLAATMGSEATAAAVGQAAMRRDPMAMLPFCGYKMADYFAHWLAFGRKLPNPPRIFRVNWFRKDENGKFIWPGFGENMRVLSWILDRVQGRGYGVESPLGWMPRHEDIPWQGTDFPENTLYDLMSVSRDAAGVEVRQHEELFDVFLDRLPKEFVFEREWFKSRLWRSPVKWQLAHDPT